jgi:hypothetical protein
MPLAVNNNPEPIANPMNAHQHTHYLGSEYINTPHYQYTISPVHHLIQPYIGALARAFILNDTGNIYETAAY